MTVANLDLGPNTINFNLSTSDGDVVDDAVNFNGQWWTIHLIPGLALPALTDSGTTIDGFSQPESTTDPEFGANVNLVGTGGTVGVDNVTFPKFEQPEIAIDANTADHGFSIDGAASFITLIGMSVYDVGVPDTDSAAVRGDGGLGTNRLVQEMFLGVLPDGNAPLVAEQNKGFGGRQMDGGFLEVTRSLVGFHGKGGLDGEASTSVVIFTFNEVKESGLLTNSHDGVDVNGKNGIARYNLTYNNRTLNMIPNGGGGNGIELGSNSSSTSPDNNLIENNTTHGNVSAGISIRKGPVANVIRKNVSFDNEVGISVNWEERVTNRNQLSQNSTFLNMGLGIDLQLTQNFVPPDAPETIPDFSDPNNLPAAEPWFGFAIGGLPATPLAAGPDGVTANDDVACDADEGSNDLQNFPELTSALTTGSQVIIDGKLTSTASTMFRIEFFATPTSDMFMANDREGKRFLGEIFETTDTACMVTFSAQFTQSVDPQSEVITATATKFTNDNEVWSTSEYGGPITVNQVDLSAKVTGGGWYVQPATGVPAGTSDKDRASFGFVAMFRQGNDIPQGNTTFRYHPTKMQFHSTSYERLSLIVMGGPQEPQTARWRGLGTVNNQPGFEFKVHLTDNGEPGNMDTWRIKIWQDNDGNANTEMGTVIYDNGPAENETIINGNLQVHMSANALEGTAGPGTTEVLTVEALQPIIDDATAFWRAEGVDEASLSSISNATFAIANLPDAILGVAASGIIGIDRDAAGNGWSLLSDPSAGRVDLLTVVTHEIGHLLGFRHDDEHSVMAATLQTGVSLTSMTDRELAGRIGSFSGTISAESAPFPVTGSAGVSAGLLGVMHNPNFATPISSSVVQIELPLLSGRLSTTGTADLNLVTPQFLTNLPIRTVPFSWTSEGMSMMPYDFSRWYARPDWWTEATDAQQTVPVNGPQPPERRPEDQTVPADPDGIPVFDFVDPEAVDGAALSAVADWRRACDTCFAQMVGENTFAQPVSRSRAGEPVSDAALAAAFTLAALAGGLRNDMPSTLATPSDRRRSSLSPPASE